MSSPCLSGGGGRTYAFELDIVVKSPSPSSTITSHTSSPSSVLSESSNSPLAISTRKPRTPRKRPNQTYNEAAALLSTVYPNVFSTQHLTNPRKFTKPHHDTALLLDQSSSELLWPFRVFDDDRYSGFPQHHHHHQSVKPCSFFNEAKVSNLATSSSCDKYSPSCQSGNSTEFCDGYEEDFDAESFLDEEIEEGIESIMGNLSVKKENGIGNSNSWCGNPMGFHYGWRSQHGLGSEMRKGVGALRHRDEGNWWSFPIVDMLQISPRLKNNSSNGSESNSSSKPKAKQKSNSGDKKKKKVEKPGAVELKTKEEETSIPQSNLLLKLNYDDVLNAWSDRGSPFSDEISGSEGGSDVSARLAQIDLFSGSGGMREASVSRYKEKRRTRLYSKKIRYQVRKVNADQRPRMKGRFVRRPNSSANSQRREE